MFTAHTLSAVSVTLQGVEVALVPMMAVFVSSLFVLLLLFFRIWYFSRRRLLRRPITANYVTPAGFTPAEISYMFNGKLRDREIGATIVFLIQKGFLHLKIVNNKKRIFAGPQVSKDLKKYEQKLFDIADKPEGATLEEMLRELSGKTKNKTTNVTMQFLFTQFVHIDLQGKKYVQKSRLRRFFLGALKSTLLIIVFLIVAPITLAWFFDTVRDGASDVSALEELLLGVVQFCGLFFAPFFVLGVVVAYLRGRIVGREWIKTSKLKHLWPQIIGYRQFVKLVEKDRLTFGNKTLEKDSKNDTLPYAIALGFVKNWRDILS